MARATGQREYRRRQPETTVLYRVLAEHLETFLARVDDDATLTPLPGFVRRELRAFLRCGQLSHGFCRLRCEACGTDEVVAFACKRRGFCPACCSRRMADLAAHPCQHRTKRPSDRPASKPTRPKSTWAELLARVYGLDVLRCPCGGRRHLLTFLTDPPVVEKILAHLGLPITPPTLSPARAPPPRQLVLS